VREFRRQKFLRFNERPVEFGFVFRKVAEIYPLHILDVGTGTTALPHLMRNCGCLVTAVDNVRDYWSFGMSNRHYHIIDDDITNTRLKGPFDMVTCISVLEHIEKHDDAIRNMFSLLKPKGHLILTCPYTEKSYVRNVYELPGSSYGQGAPYVTQSYSRNELNRWVEANKASIVEQEFWQYWDGEYWTIGKQIIPPKKVSAADEHQLTCVLFQKN
jgi:2-polyprenyl-3-methyl-5-hydroxy-6-metoxy-1,4-benzoquinol methylase